MTEKLEDHFTEAQMDSLRQLANDYDRLCQAVKDAADIAMVIFTAKMEALNNVAKVAGWTSEATK